MALRKRGNFLNLLQKDGGTHKREGVPILEETMGNSLN